MVWREAQRNAQTRHWPDVDRLLTGLPARLFRQAKLVQYDLALRYSDSGQFPDIFLGVDRFPILSVASWLLDDFRVPPGPDRDDIERRLFLASVLLAVRTQSIESLGDPSSFTGDDQVALVVWLSERAAVELARVVPRESSFWEEHDAILRDHLERLLEQRERVTEADLPGSPGAYLSGLWYSPAQLLALAVTALTARDESSRRISEMLEDLAKAFQILTEVASMHRDLQQGRTTYPIAVIAEATGIPLRPPPESNLLLGAMVATGSLAPILASAVAKVRHSHAAAIDLQLPTFAAFLADVEARIVERSAIATGAAGAPRSDASPNPPLLLASEPTLPTALAMAQGFLLADLTFKESWEMHREGMLGAAEVASRFPAGLILEFLAAHGHDVSPQVDEFMAFTAANGFRYYDHPWSDPDSDTVGVFLRLMPYATESREHDQALAAVTSCLERVVRDNGAVPVWIIGCDGPEGGRPEVLALGEGCGTVAAHLLLGLNGIESQRHQDTIETGARHLMDRICDVGLGANVNYPPWYALAVFLRLVARLEDRNLRGNLAQRVGEAKGRLLAELDQATTARLVSAQAAALLAAACFEADRADLLDPTWMTTVLKRQRADGSWIGEPFAAAPNRGGWVSWYSSATLTTALCYDALARYANTGDRSND